MKSFYAMKKRFLFYLAGALVTVALLVPFAREAVLAEENEDVSVTVTADTAELSESAPVTLTFTVSNYSGYELHNIAIYRGTTSFSVEGMEDYVIPPGGTGIYPLTVEYPDEWIGLPVEFIVTYLKYGEPYSHTVTVNIARAVEPVIGLTRTVSAAQARAGETVVFTYELVNDTKFDMEDITLVDEQVSDKAIFRNHTLYAGSRMTQTSTYTMQSGDVTSAPVITYDVNGKTKTFSAVEPVTVKLVDVRLSLTVETGTQGPTGMPFVLTVKNEGNIAVENISVYDERDQAVSTDVFSLEPGEEQALSYTVIPALTEQVRQVKFVLYGVDGLGNAYETASPATYTVYPYVDDTQIDVTLSAQCVSDWDARRGVVKVRFSIVNYSDVVLTNMRVTEELLGNIASYTELVTGNTVFEQELPLASPRSLAFSVYAFDPAGTERLLAALNLNVDYPVTTEVPAEQQQPTPEPLEDTAEAGGEASRQGTVSLSDTILRALIIVGSVLGAGFVALIVLTILEHSKSGGILSDFGPDDDDGEDGSSLIDMSLVQQPQRESAVQVQNEPSAVTGQEVRQSPSGERAKPREASDYIRIAAQRRAGYDASRHTAHIPVADVVTAQEPTRVLPSIALKNDAPGGTTQRTQNLSANKPAPEIPVMRANGAETQNDTATHSNTAPQSDTAAQNDTATQSNAAPQSDTANQSNMASQSNAAPQSDTNAFAVFTSEERIPSREDKKIAPRRIEAANRPAVREAVIETPRHVRKTTKPEIKR